MIDKELLIFLIVVPAGLAVGWVIGCLLHGLPIV
jgi:hypothetical protein